MSESRRQLEPHELEECENVRRLILEAGFTIKGAADALGISQPGLTRYCTGKIPVNLDFAILVSNLVRRPLWEISPRLHKRWSMAFQDNSELISGIKGMELLDPEVRKSLESSIRLMISGAISQVKPDDFSKNNQ